MINDKTMPYVPTQKVALQAQMDAIYAGIRKDRTQALLAAGDPATQAWVTAQIAIVEGAGGLRAQWKLLP